MVACSRSSLAGPAPQFADGLGSRLTSDDLGHICNRWIYSGTLSKIPLTKVQLGAKYK